MIPKRIIIISEGVSEFNNEKISMSIQPSGLISTTPYRNVSKPSNHVVSISDQRGRILESVKNRFRDVGLRVEPEKFCSRFKAPYRRIVKISDGSVQIAISSFNDNLILQDSSPCHVHQKYIENQDTEEMTDKECQTVMQVVERIKKYGGDIDRFNKGNNSTTTCYSSSISKLDFQQDRAAASAKKRFREDDDKIEEERPHARFKPLYHQRTEKCHGAMFCPTDERFLKATATKMINIEINSELSKTTMAEEVVRICQRDIERFNEVNISTAIHRLGKFTQTNRELSDSTYIWMDALAEKAADKLQDFKPQHLANIAWSFATLGIYNETLFLRISHQIKQKLKDFTPQNLSNTVWAFAALGIHSEELFNVIADEVELKLQRCNSQCLSNIAWSFAVHGIFPSSLAKALILSMDPRLALGFECLRQMKQVLLHFRFEKRDLAMEWPKGLLAQIEAVSFPSAPSSATHLECSRVLSSIGIAHVNEGLVNAVSVDILIEEPKIVIEVDGPTHFKRKSKDPLGRTLFKRRLLKAMGWQVISIPYWGWYQQKTEAEQQKYLCEMLSIPEVSPLPGSD